jgi:hypothetical protein
MVPGSDRLFDGLDPAWRVSAASSTIGALVAIDLAELTVAVGERGSKRRETIPTQSSWQQRRTALRSLWGDCRSNTPKYNNGRRYMTSDTDSFCALRGDNTSIDSMHDSRTFSCENKLRT